MIAYLDHAATTPMRPEAIEAARAYADENFGNPSGMHALARSARKALDDAREDVASAIGFDSSELIFTSGGSEADNLAVLGIVGARGGTAVCSSIEHPAVLRCVEELGGRVVPVSTDGLLDLDELERTLDDGVSVVSVMAANNEIGVVQDLESISRIVRHKSPNAVLHTDAVQAMPWIDVRDIAPLVDLMTISAHKFGGPKGIGALGVRRGHVVKPLVRGGGQERGLRSGTQNVAGAVAMAAAAKALVDSRDTTATRVRALRDRLVDGLTRSIDGVEETVGRQLKVVSNCHVMVDGVEGEALLLLLDADGVYASAGSACSSGAMEPSHVIVAIGAWSSRCAVRLTLGYCTNDSEIDHALDVIPRAITKLRSAR